MRVVFRLYEIPEHYHESFVHVQDPYLIMRPSIYLSVRAVDIDQNLLRFFLFLLEGKLSQINAVLAPIGGVSLKEKSKACTLPFHRIRSQVAWSWTAK